MSKWTGAAAALLAAVAVRALAADPQPPTPYVPPPPTFGNEQQGQFGNPADGSFGNPAEGSFVNPHLDQNRPRPPKHTSPVFAPPPPPVTAETPRAPVKKPRRHKPHAEPE